MELENECLYYQVVWPMHSSDEKLKQTNKKLNKFRNIEIGRRYIDNCYQTKNKFKLDKEKGWVIRWLIIY